MFTCKTIVLSFMSLARARGPIPWHSLVHLLAALAAGGVSQGSLSWAESGRTPRPGQCRAGHDSAGKDGAGQSRAGQGKAGQGRAGRDQGRI